MERPHDKYFSGYRYVHKILPRQRFGKYWSRSKFSKLYKFILELSEKKNYLIVLWYLS